MKPNLWNVQGPPHYIYVVQDLHPKSIGFHEVSASSGDTSQCQDLWSLSLPQLSTPLRGSLLFPCSCTPSPVGVGELPLAQVICLSGWPSHYFEFLFHTLNPSTLQLELQRSVLCSYLGHCICSLLLMDEGSMVICVIIINITTG